MAITGIDFLLGNDFLKQFGNVRIEEKDQRPLLTLGDLLLNVIQLPMTKEQNTHYSVISVATVSTGCPPNPLLLEPSTILLAYQSLSIGHALMSDLCPFIPIANLSAHPVWIGEGTLKTFTTTDIVFFMNRDHLDVLPNNGVSIYI